MPNPAARSALAARKAELRRSAFAARKAAHDAGDSAAEAACERLLGSGLYHGRDVIAGYRPIRTEIDPTPVMCRLSALGHRLAVPVIEGERRPLAFREWRPGATMVPGPFGAEIPAEGDWLEPDLLIVPLVAFDRDLWRLGYGGGFYDRSLARLRALKPVSAVGFAYAVQEVPEIPREPTDERLDAVVTERGVLRL